jgi:Cu(I)/Ag(I) efflux system periplasmic protein CusF
MNDRFKRSIPVVAALLAVAGCNDSQSAPKASATAGNAMAGMNNDATAAAPIKAKSTGTVTALDKDAGTVTLDHQPIPEARWPAMTMGFAAEPALLAGLEVGDRVAFDVEITGSSGKVTSISKQ